MPGEGSLWVDREALLTFYDDPPQGERGIHATAINAVAGEEFGLALLIRYLKEAGVDAALLDAPCTTGGRRGHRLDGWVQTPEVLYQVEVKNWSANSLRGRRLPLIVNDDEARTHRVALWNEYWDAPRSTFMDTPAAKVLEPMKPPVQGLAVEPLIAFWVSLHPTGEDEPWFSIALPDQAFDHVNVFSMSTYLRGLAAERIELPLPLTTARLGILHRIFGATGTE